LNYYEHHLGDYLRDTAHLSMVEDGAYRRLLDTYYVKEAPLPLELRDVFRLVRAGSKPERDAVTVVLREFFLETPEGWRHKRCDAEIARFQDKQAKARRSAEARWSAHQTQSGGNANASGSAMRTHSEGNAPRARPQAPDTSHQTPDTNPPEQSAGEICRRMRAAGMASVNPSSPKLRALLDAGMTADELLAATDDAVKGGKGFAWVLATAEGRRRDAATAPLPARRTPAPAPAPEPGWVTERRERIAEAAPYAVARPRSTPQPADEVIDAPTTPRIA